MPKRLLNLLHLAGEDVDLFRLTRFEGREAICEPFDYSLELVTATKPKLGNWIGKGAEWDVAPAHDDARTFAGQIHEAMVVDDEAEFQRIQLRVRPVFYGTIFGRGISFFQDKHSIQILEELTKTLPGLVVDKGQAGTPPKRAYAVKYDETEFEFLTRLLAQDGIMYYFVHDRTAGKFRHKMVLASAASAYRDVPGADALEYNLPNARNSITNLQHSYETFAHRHGYGGAIVNKLDTLVMRRPRSGRSGARHSTAATRKSWAASPIPANWPSAPRSRRSGTSRKRRSSPGRVPCRNCAWPGASRMPRATIHAGWC
jgi:type VI secretion system secreted protein VgrG